MQSTVQSILNMKEVNYTMGVPSIEAEEAGASSLSE